jgi:hypothetical protein
VAGTFESKGEEGVGFAPNFIPMNAYNFVPNRGRDLFVTEDIVLEFKRQGLKGGMFERLLTKEEEAQVQGSGCGQSSI